MTNVRPAPGRPTILLVEDDEELQRSLVASLAVRYRA